MRILATADLHGALAAYTWLGEVVRELRPDAVVLAGDLLGGGIEAASIEAAHAGEARNLAELLAQFECPVLYIMGNDDMAAMPERSGYLIPLHGRRWEGARFNFVGYQYSLPFMGGIFEKPESEIAVDLRTLSPLVDERSVLVTHSPAFGILDTGILGLHAGSLSILRLVQDRKPLVHLHGHIHQAAGRQGKHFNVAAAGKRRAVHLDLERLEGEVVIED